MAGIIGKLSFDRDETLARPVLEQMLGALRHRGTTGSDIYSAPGIALGWCGVDVLSRHHAGVATNEAGTLHVAADADLTNAAALQSELRRCHHNIQGPTDADVIAHAYEEWGDDCVDRLRGPFAFAVWDDVRQRLVLARDPLGIRPLFFAFLHGHGVVFGSEIRALLQDPGVEREWAPEAIDAYLALGYVPAPLTVYRRISKVEPAQRLVVEGRRLHVDQYWDPPVPASAPGAAGERDIVDALAAHLQDVVSTAGEGYGLLYSGGMASTALLTAIAPGSRVVTATGDADPGEIARSHAAARALGCEPNIEVAVPHAAAIAPDIALHLDEPVGDPAAVLQYALFLAARTHTDAAVTGHGAAAFWGTATVGAHESAVSGWLQHLSRRPVTRCHPSTPFWDDRDRRAIYTRNFAWQVRDADPFARHLELQAARDTGDAADRALYVGVRTTLPDNTLAFTERATLAAGLSVRFPFLERELVELAMRLPSYARQGTAGVWPLHALIARRLPASLAPAAGGRPAPPRWLADALNLMVPEFLLTPRFDGRGIVSRPAVRQLWHEHAEGRRDHSLRLWSLLMLEFWFREFIDGDAAGEPVGYAMLKAA